MEAAFELRGEFPILWHADDVLAADDLDQWRKATENKNVSKAGDDRSPPWTWQTYLYSDGERLAWPAANLMVCLRSAGAQLILKKQKTFKELTQSGMIINSEFCEFLADGRPVSVADVEALKDLPFSQQAQRVKDLGFTLFVKRARVGQAKHVRVRARFDRWTIRGTVLVKAKEITYEVLEKLFEIAGGIGLGDWRPGCKTPGPYGQFKASLKLLRKPVAA